MKALYLAQNVGISGQTIEGPLKNLNTVGDVVSKVVNSFLIPAAGIILLFILVWGGYDFILSQGSPEKVKAAKAKITAGVVGFLLLILSYLAVRIISNIFGIGQEVFP